MKADPFNKLLPPVYRSVGFALLAIALALSILIKMTANEDSLKFSSGFFPFIFLLAITLILSSKSKFEDERLVIMRHYVYNTGYQILIGYIIFRVFDNMVYGSPSNYNNLLFALIGILIYQMILFEIMKNGTFLNWIEKSYFNFILSALLIIIPSILICEWLWTI